MLLRNETSSPVIEVLSVPTSTLAQDVQWGLCRRPKTLPCKYFYDEEGSRLFDRICDTEEYYPTRAEQGLLESIADELLERFRPTHLVELGSGAARKTRLLFRAQERRGKPLTYLPFDVSEAMLRESARALRKEFRWLAIHGLVGDYDRDLDRIPRQGRRLFAFLGGTIGNLTEEEGARFLGKLALTMGPEDRLLLGTDLLKDPAVLHRAYNDRQGLTAAFNKNVLRVINRVLDADFDLDRFDHLAFFDADRAQIEMHLRAGTEHEVRIRKLDLRVPFAAGETIRTEISRKFTPRTVESLLQKAGLEMEAWYTPADGSFGLSVSRPARL